MKFKQRLLAFLPTFFIFFTGCGNLSVPSNANNAFRNFTLELFRQEVTSNTINLHYTLQEPDKYDIHNSPITLGSFDIDPALARASIENLDAALHKFSYRSLSKENQITYDVLNYYFDMMQKDISYYLYEEPLSPVTGIHAQLPVLLAEYQFYQKEDVDTYLSLLQTLPDYFSSLARFEQKKSEAGLFMSDSIADAVIAQCDAFISMKEENYLLSTFEERIKNLTELTPTEADDYIQRNCENITSFVVPAYETLASSIESLKGTGKNTKGLCSLPEGSEYYTHLVAVETGSSRTIPELKSLIHNQIAADILDNQQIISSNSDLKTGNSSTNQSPDSMLATLKAKISNAFPDATPVGVEVKYVPKALEQYLSPAFYLIPAIDDYEENTIYINQAYSLDDIHLFTTLAHEGYPGHLYQTTFYAATNPDPIRTLLTSSGYVEGWATYAEMCSYSISSLEKTYATFLQKNNSAILGLYAAADIGIHYDGWSLSDTVAFFSSYGINDETAIQEIYDYIVGDPANYLKYYVGYLEILELKKDMNLSSQKEFHKKLLEIGPAPFEIIRKHLMGT